MKKMRELVVGVVLAGLAGVGWCDDMLTIRLDTNNDRYSDGTPVRDGEWYALVWVKDGVSFAGFNADGSLANAPGDAKFFVACPWAKDGHVANKSYALRKAQYGDCLGKGTWNVYVLDTRVMVDQNGTPTYVAAPHEEGNKFLPQTVNGWGLIEAMEVVYEGGEYKAGCDLYGQNRDVEIAKENVAGVPEGSVEPPAVSNIRVDGDTIFLSVSKTVKWLQYTAEAGTTPGTVGERRNVARMAKRGDETKTIELEIPKDKGTDAQFFRVSRHLP